MSDHTSDRDDCRQFIEDARRDGRSTAEIISQALAEADEFRAWDHVITLHFRATRDVLVEAVALCASECPQERTLGANILGQLGIPRRAFPEECHAALVRLLQEEDDPEVLNAACVACGHLKHPQAVPFLTALSRHSEEDVRLGVVHGLLAREDPEAVECLIVLSADADADVRDWATFGLGSQIDVDEPPLRAALLARLADTDLVARAEAMVGLARRRDERVIPALLDALHSARFAEYHRSDLVLEAVEEIADPRLVPALLRLSRRGGAEVSDLIRICQEGGRSAP
jgi:HEAT repeat protein